MTEPQPTFSTCFGAPFMPRRPEVYGKLLQEKIARHGATCWLVNTGWTGGAYGTGTRMPIKATRALLDRRARRRVSTRSTSARMRTSASRSRCRSPASTTRCSTRARPGPITAAYDAQAKKLVHMFADNFAQYVPFIDARREGRGDRLRSFRGGPRGRAPSGARPFP